MPASSMNETMPISSRASASRRRRPARTWPRPSRSRTRASAEEVGPTGAPFKAHVRSPAGLRRYRQREGTRRGAGRPPGARLRRAAAGRPRELAERRAHLRRGEGDGPDRRQRRSMCSAPRSCAFSTASSTRAATAIASPAPTRRSAADAARHRSSRTCSGSATGTCAPRPATLGILEPATTGRSLGGKLPAGLDYNVEMALQRGSLGTDDVRAWAGHWQLRESLPDRSALRAHRRIQLRVRRREPGRRHARHVRPAVSDAARQVRPRRSGRLAEHPPRCAPASSSRRCKALPVTANYHSWWLAEKRDGLYTAAARCSRACLPAPLEPRRTGDRRPGRRGRSRRSCSWPAGYAHIFTGRVPEAGDAGRVLQPPLRRWPPTSSSRSSR